MDCLGIAAYGVGERGTAGAAISSCLGERLRLALCKQRCGDDQDGAKHGSQSDQWVE